MRIDLLVKKWFNIVCILVLLPFSHLVLSNYTKLDPPAALALIDENGHAEIPDTYTIVGADAFKDSDLVSVTIPSSITSIEDFAFYRTKLTSVTIPASVINIGQHAFRGRGCQSYYDEFDEYVTECHRLSTLNFADNSQLTTIENYAFKDNRINSVVIPDSVTVIADAAFSGNYNLESLTIGNSVVSIGGEAFSSANLSSITIPASVNTIGSYAFHNNGQDDCDWNEYDGSKTCNTPTELHFVEGGALSDIYDGAFSYSGIESVSIPDSVTYLGSEAFSGNQISSLSIGGSLSNIRADMFRYNPIETLVLGGAISSIGENAFKNFPLSSVILGANVTSIGDAAFNAVNGDVFILKPAHENFDIYNFSSMANVYACDSLDDAGVPQDCSDAWPDDGIDVPEWPINICDSDSSLPECDPCTLDPESCDPCTYDPDSCTEVPDLMTQNISVTNSPKGILGKAAVLEVSYDTSDSNNQLTGIGMRVHFNSSLLGFKEITNLIEQDIIVSGDGPHNDEDDFDNDPLTDKYISFGWASLFGNWPNVELPIVLMNIAFDVFDTIDTDAIAETNINFSKTAFTVGYEFEAENYNLELKTASWDFDGSGHADALTDGLMMLRYCFGLRGDSVTTSAMAIDSPMNSEQVVTEIESALDMANIDDDGEVRALTDGLILLRYLFDLRGDQLTAATVSLTANRSSNKEIEAYIEAYMP
jgi:hypothetical protein